MRTTRFRPIFDLMDLRITPSDIALVPSPSSMITPPPANIGITQDITDPEVGPITWVVAGNPPPPSGGDITEPDTGPLTWVVATP